MTVIDYYKGLYPWQIQGFSWMIQFKRADLNQSHHNVVDEWSSGNCIQSKYVSQLTRDPLHTHHIKGDEAYFPFWMNALNVYDLLKAIDNNIFSICASRVILLINLGHDGMQFVTNLFIPTFLPQIWDKWLNLHKNICTWQFKMCRLCFW